MRPPYRSFPSPLRSGLPEEFGEREGSGMRWRLLFALIGLSITGVTSFAQRPPGAEGLAAGRSSPSEFGTAEFRDAGFFGGAHNQPGVVKFMLVQGRLCLDPPRHRKGSQSCREGDVFESICVTAQRGVPSLQYICQTPHQDLRVNVQDADAVRIESFLPGRSQRSVLHHQRSGDIVWQRTDSKEREEIVSVTASTLLHLRHSHPADFDAHFGHLISRILQGTSLQTLCQQTEAILIAETAAGTAEFSESDIATVVEGLRSPRRGVRTQSVRTILAWGTPALASLDAVDRSTLDIEQLDRLDFIRNQLRQRTPDTPRTLAKLLINDPAYWLSIADQLSHTDKQIAENRLRQVGFEVSLLEADPVEYVASQ
ncbi:hypothetical protein [Rubripirellula reticaptiva]|uniref:Uncharacterized protein n=1 Tax=Rubripirellula reticaptiva TaxID=2528013 RepID=A0A5C6F9K6_9BACT|nr:hypothetical protein [Rubripirellula reticaptiva]TWU58068.1 hypothetical protein Poly59_09770 [Rubripirellula reticaptiva]